MERKVEIFAFRLSPRERDVLLRVADRDNRTPSNWLRHQIYLAGASPGEGEQVAVADPHLGLLAAASRDLRGTVTGHRDEPKTSETEGEEDKQSNPAR